jgi:hypothetical protein
MGRSIVNLAVVELVLEEATFFQGLLLSPCAYY